MAVKNVNECRLELIGLINFKSEIRTDRASQYFCGIAHKYQFFYMIEVFVAVKERKIIEPRIALESISYLLKNSNAILTENFKTFSVTSSFTLQKNTRNNFHIM